MSIKIAIFHSALSDRYATLVQTVAPELELRTASCEAEAPAAIAGAEILLTSVGFPASALLATPELRWIQVLGAGVDRIVPAIPPGVRVTRLTGSFGERMAEYAIGYVLAITQRIPTVLHNQGQQRWAPQSLGTARGQTLGVVGLGSIGAEVARLGARIGMRVVGFSTRPTSVTDIDQWYGPGEFDQFLGSADFVVLAVPATAATNGLLDRASLACMRPNAWLINMARGSVVDEQALIEALTDNRIGGAVLDVFATEPLPSTHPFWQLPNVIVTPHHSGDAIPEEAVDLFRQNLARYRSGESLLNEVDLGRGY